MKPDRPIGLRAYFAYLRGYTPVLAVAAGLAAVGAASAILQPLVIRQVIDALQFGEAVTGLIILLVAFVLATAVVGAMRDFLLQRAAERLVFDVRQTLAQHIVRLPVAEFDRRRTGDLLSRVSADSTLVRVVVTSGLFELTVGIVMVVGAAVLMLVIDTLLFTVACAGALAGLALTVPLARRLRFLAERVQARLGEMTARLERAVSGARVIRACRAESREGEAIAASAEAACAAGVRQARVQAVIGPLVTTSVQGSLLLVLGVGGARVAAGAITIGELVAFMLYLFFLLMPLVQAIGAYAQLQAGLGALHRIEEILAIPTEDAGSGGITGRTDRGDRLPHRVAVSFEAVTFSYDGTTPVLRDVTFTVATGSRTAIVGPSGAGKSTLLALIERFYPLEQGTIRLGDADIRSLPLEQLRARLGYLEQGTPVLAGSIRDNLLLGRSDATDDELWSILNLVNLEDVVARTPHRLDQPVGEGGVLLSGGERQRLAFARALLADPPLLLLDEPTSNLDARNEAALRRAIDVAAGERTLIIVAHRLSTVVDADQIIVLDRGEVVGLGTHDELAAESGLYREFATHQLMVT
jgi:ATP-binding cassette subfamily B protein/ATP-binding cassette subfamily C protein